MQTSLENLRTHSASSVFHFSAGTLASNDSVKGKQNVYNL
jgi:hypothetical protein